MTDAQSPTPIAMADRLNAAIDRSGSPACVGIDPVFAKLPSVLQGQVSKGDTAGELEAIEAFCKGVIWAVADHVPAVKPQMACFERYGSAGVELFFKVVTEAKRCGLFVVADAKRGDIGTSSAHYGHAFFKHDAASCSDALTVNSYLGVDGMQPMIDAAAAVGSGVFVLVRTSNPGGDALQGLMLQDGRSVGEAVADFVAELGESYMGDSGYSSVGAVVGATKVADMRALRQRMSKQIFLVPGYGAQGGTAADVRACFNADGRGALITASRSVNYAFAADQDQDGADWTAAVEAAAVAMKRDLADVLS